MSLLNGLGERKWLQAYRVVEYRKSMNLLIEQPEEDTPEDTV
jgi:hypothetical protein